MTTRSPKLFNTHNDFIRTCGRNITLLKVGYFDRFYQKEGAAQFPGRPFMHLWKFSFEQLDYVIGASLEKNDLSSSSTGLGDHAVRTDQDYDFIGASVRIRCFEPRRLNGTIMPVPDHPVNTKRKRPRSGPFLSDYAGDAGIEPTSSGLEPEAHPIYQSPV